jgi:DHA1 family bicyclomycin/chloramphenicol resistance-like MFS transporter
MNPPLKSSHRIPGWVLLIGVMTGIGPASIDMYLPAFALIEREFAEQGIERTLAAYLIGMALGQLVYGPASDRFGRKPPLYVGFGLYVIGSLGCAFANSMMVLIVMRVLQALGACSAVVIGRAIVRDRCKPEEAARAFSTLMFIMSLSPILAPLFGGWFVAALGWRSVFIFQCLLGLGLVVAMHRMMTESRDPAHVVPLSFAQVARGYGRLFAQRKFVAYSVLGGFSTAALFSYIAGLPTIMTHLYDLTPQQFGWIIAMNGIGFMSASRLNMIALRHFTPAAILPRVIWVPLLIGLLFCGLALSPYQPLWVLLVLQFTFFMSAASIGPQVSALALADQGRQAGSASALMGAIQSSIGTAGGMIIGVTNDGTLLPLALMLAGGGAGMCLGYGWVRSAR